MPYSISIVIPTYNGRELLAANLPHFEHAARRYTGETGLPAEILVVDDGGGDGTPAWLAEAHPAVRCLALEKNAGFGAACNAGVAAARHPLVFLANNDVRPEADCLAPLARHFARGPVAGAGDLFAVQAQALDPETGERSEGRKYRLFRRLYFRNAARRRQVQTETAAYTLYATGGHSLMSREKFLAMGGFHPLYHPYYWEDTDLGYRAWARGWRVLYEPASRVYHPRGQTIVARERRARLVRVGVKNKLVFIWSNTADRGLLARHLLGLAANLIRSALACKFSVWRGFFDALALRGPIMEKRRAEMLHRRRSDREILACLDEPVPDAE